MIVVGPVANNAPVGLLGPPLFGCKVEGGWGEKKTMVLVEPAW